MSGATIHAAEAVPAVGVSLTANIGSDRQIVLQGHYARGDAVEGDALLAEMNRRIDVMKAPSEIERLERELRQQKDGLANQLRNIALLDDNAAKEQAARIVTLNEAETTLEKADEKARSDWYAKGKEGEYREGQQVKQMRERLADMRAKAREEAEKAESERTLANAQAKINQGRFEFEIAETELKIAAQRALLPTANDGS